MYSFQGLLPYLSGIGLQQQQGGASCCSLPLTCSTTKTNLQTRGLIARSWGGPFRAPLCTTAGLLQAHSGAPQCLLSDFIGLWIK